MVRPSPAWPKPLKPTSFSQDFDHGCIEAKCPHRQTMLQLGPPQSGPAKSPRTSPSSRPLCLLILLSGMQRSNCFPTPTITIPNISSHPSSYYFEIYSADERSGVVSHYSSEPASTERLRCVAEDSDEIKTPICYLEKILKGRLRVTELHTPTSRANGRTSNGRS